MLTNSCISNMYYGSNPTRVGTDENYDLKSKKLHSLQEYVIILINKMKFYAY